MPVGRVFMGKSPQNSRSGQTTRDVWVFVDIGVIVEIEELVMDCLAENEPCDRREKNADPEDQPALAPVGCFPGYYVDLDFLLIRSGPTSMGVGRRRSKFLALDVGERDLNLVCSRQDE